MNPTFERLQQAAAGLLMLSESEAPFEVFETEIRPVFAENTPLETITVPHFFRRAVEEHSWHEESERQTAQRFQALVKTLETELTDLEVIKAGKIEIEVFIIGKTPTGKWAGLKTKVIET